MEYQPEQRKSTHIVFDGEKIFISPDIFPVMHFLMEIEKEIESILGFQEKLEKIRKQYLETINLVGFLAKKLKENNIEFKYSLKENPKSIAKNFKFYPPVRSQMIVLFASLEVLYCLHTAYEKELDDEDKMRKNTMGNKGNKNLKKFINSFLLTEKNNYYKNNKSRLSKIDFEKIRSLRNTLTHFFSLSSGGLSIIPNILNEKARKLENLLEKNKNAHIVFISPEDLYELIKSANLLRIREWVEDFNTNKEDFERKISFVISLVKKYGAVVVPDKNLKV